MTKATITWTIAQNGYEGYGPEEIDQDAFDRYVAIEEREVAAAFPQFDFEFRMVPEPNSLNNRPTGSTDEAMDALEDIEEFVGSNWVYWLEEAHA